MKLKKGLKVKFRSPTQCKAIDKTIKSSGYVNEMDELDRNKFYEIKRLNDLNGPNEFELDCLPPYDYVYNIKWFYPINNFLNNFI